jgi:hypothetical protein
MTVSFPAICPTRRTYTPGKYPTKKITSINGATTTRLYGSKAFDATMSLSFLLNDAEMSELLNSWHESRGGFDTLNLPYSVFAGISPDLQTQIPEYLQWRWAEMPSVESVMPDRSRVQVQLIATLDS